MRELSVEGRERMLCKETPPSGDEDIILDLFAVIHLTQYFIASLNEM
jgi:hypothetical protein